MALSIDALPEEVEASSATLRARLEQHRSLRTQFADAALTVDEPALKAVRGRLADADEKVEAAYAQLRDAVMRFGSNVCAAVRSLLEEPA